MGGLSKVKSAEALVSVVVAIYNAEAYLEECLDSLCSQTYRNLQIILVNDGSTDSSIDIAKRYENKDPRILLINQVNGGVAAARQAGVYYAQGSFIIHADSDDLVPAQAIEQLVQRQVETDSDIVIGAYAVRQGSEDTVVAPPEDADYQETVEELLLGKLHGALWNKLIRKELYEGVGFESGINYMEDKLILARMLSHRVCKISTVSDVVYVYRQHGDSTTAKFSMESVTSAGRVYASLVELFKGKVSNEIISHVEREGRVFILLQGARNGELLFENSDRYLLCDSRVGLNKRIALWFVRLRMTFAIRVYYGLMSLVRY